MNNQQKLIVYLYKFIAFLILSSVKIYSDDPIDNNLAEKIRLTQKLDSIEVQKQIQKRNGESIEDLEIYTKKILDSIVNIKATIEQDYQNKNFTELAMLKIQEHFSKMPTKPIEWAMYIAGVVLVLIILAILYGTIFGLIKRLRRPKTQKLKNRLEKNQKPMSTTTLEEPSQANPYSAYKQSIKPKSTESITRLRMRIQEESQPSQMPAPQILTSNESFFADAEENTSDPNSYILQDLQKGIPVSDIAKRHHVSIDQIHLLSKVSGLKINK